MTFIEEDVKPISIEKNPDYAAGVRDGMWQARRLFLESGGNPADQIAEILQKAANTLAIQITNYAMKSGYEEPSGKLTW